MLTSANIKINQALLIIIIILLSSYSTLSQFTGYGNDQRYQASMILTKLDKIPPFESEMPVSCHNSYNIIESISKTLSCDFLIDKLKYSTIDSIKYFTGFLYEVLDYSPYLFRRYSTTMNSSEYQGIYKSNPSCLFVGLQSILYDRYRDLFSEAQVMIFSSHYILHIKIDSVIVGTDTSGKEPLRWVNVSASIANSYKGKKLPSNCKIEGSQLYSEMFVTNNECINFGYIENWETGTGLSFNLLPKGKIRTVRKGEEYIAFLRHIPDDKQIDIITLENRFDVSGGLFRIDNNLISDPGNFFKLGTNVDLGTFQSALNNRIEVIKSWYNKYSYVDEQLNIDGLTLYPIPVETSLNIKIRNSNLSIFRASIYNLMGELLYTDFFDANGHQTIKLDASNVQNGTYILKLQSDRQIFSRLFTVIR